MRKALTSLALALSPTRNPALSPLRAMFSLDLRALALFRIGIGLLLALDTWMRAYDLRAHYTDFGILPTGPAVSSFLNDLHVSLHLASGAWGWQALLFALTFVAGACVAVGFHTRTASAVGWVLLLSVQNRNPMILNGGDVLLRLLYFWALFLPLGRVWSVDAALRADRQDESPTYFGGGTIALVLQIALIYLATVALKTGREWIPDGTASYYALNLDQFTTDYGRFLLNFPRLLKLGTYVVYFFEAAAGFLILSPFFLVPVRTALAFGLMLMHVNFDLSMRLGIFPWVDIVSLLPLLPGPLFDAFAALVRTPERRRMSIGYDGGSPLARRAALLARELFLIDGAKVAPFRAGGSAGQAAALGGAEAPAVAPHLWEVTDARGQRHVGWDAVVAVLAHSPWIGWLTRRLPLGWLSPLGGLAAKGFAGKRKGLDRWAEAWLPERTAGPLTESFFASFLAILAIGYCALWNLKTIPWIPFELKPPWSYVGPIFRLDQKWNMFAPFPLKDDGWYVIDGKLADGSPVDILNDAERPASYAKPERVSAMYPNARWRKYMGSIWQKSKTEHRLYLGKWICRNWNAKRDGGKRLAAFDIVFMKERTPPPGETGKVERLLIWQHDCFGKAGPDETPGPPDPET